MKKRTLGICGALAVAAVVPYVASATSLTMDAAELTADCASGSYTVNAGDSLNLNLDGDVTCSITNNGTLEISGTGTLNGGTNSAIINSGTATIESGSYTGSGNNKHTIINNESGTFEINGGNFTHTDTMGYVITNQGTMTINNADVANQITGSSLVQNGFYDGTGKTVNPEMTINGGTYTGGKYVIKNDDRGIMEINGGTFTGLEDSQGASVLLNWNKATVNGGTFDGSAAIPGYVHYAISTGTWATFAQGNTVINGGQFISSDDAPNSIRYFGDSGTNLPAEVTINGGTFDRPADKIVPAGVTNNTSPDVKDVALPDGSYFLGTPVAFTANSLGQKYDTSVRDDSLEFTAPFAANGLLTNLTVDGVEVPADDYLISSADADGNRTISLSANYIKSLSAGQHSILAIVGNNYATADFTVETSNIENPNTVDNISVYLLLAAVAVSALGASTVLSKRA